LDPRKPKKKGKKEDNILLPSLLFTKSLLFIICEQNHLDQPTFSESKNHNYLLPAVASTATAQPGDE